MDLEQRKQRRVSCRMGSKINGPNAYTPNFSHVFERIKVIQRGELIYVVVEPEEDTGSPAFVVNVINSADGQTSKTVKIPCHHSFDNVVYVGDYILWTEGDNLKWTPIREMNVKTVSIKVK